MGDVDLLVRAGRAVVGGTEIPCSVLVAGGRIVGVEDLGASVDADREVVLEPDEVLIPGLVDTHVHINEPGRTDWEGFATATRAAAAGGVTTIVDMPLNSIPPTVDVAALDAKRAAARDQVHVDVGFWGGIVPANAADPATLRALHDAGLLGFKAFLLPSGVEEFPPVGATELERAVTVLRAVDALTVVHAEDAATVEAAAGPAGHDHAAFVAGRPAVAESIAVAEVAELARRTGARLHVLHVSGAEVVPVLARAQDAGARLSAETCPHYLTLASEDVPAGATQFKCCPPVRPGANRDPLWAGLRSGILSCVVSDHSPSTPDLKALDSGDFDQAWGGIASLQVGLPVVWTAARARGVTLAEVVGWMGTAPADLVGLHRKGRIAVGADADLAVVAPDEAFVVDPSRLLHRNPLTPYAGRRLTGRVRRTWLRGRLVQELGAVTGAPTGRLLHRARDAAAAAGPTVTG